MRFAPEAVGVVLPVLAAGALVLVWGIAARGSALLGAGVVLWAAAVLLLLFFRDPVRSAPKGDDCALAPADGRIIACETLPDGRKHVAIFLSLFDVHVNRTPLAGRVRRVTETAGEHRHAGSERAARSNERVDVEADTPFGPVAWRQVAGMLARRISCRLKEGDEFGRGVRFGLIYFGSRMDVFLPSSAVLKTDIGRRVRAGETVIAQFVRKDIE
jgi:phosphatidylserine decarboxylase